jgi:phosphate:Na+ symporter
MDISILALASIGISAPMLFSKKGKTREKADVFLGFGILFLGLHFMQASIPDLSGNVEVLSWLARFNSSNILNILLFVLIVRDHRHRPILSATTVWSTPWLQRYLASIPQRR